MTLSLCHSERSEESRYHKVGVTEILPPYDRQNDTVLTVYRSPFCMTIQR